MINVIDAFNYSKEEKKENNKKLMFQLSILNDFVNNFSNNNSLEGLTFYSKISVKSNCAYEFLVYILFHLSHNLNIEAGNFTIKESGDCDYYDLSLKIENNKISVDMFRGYGDPTIDETSVYIKNLNDFNISLKDFS